MTRLAKRYVLFEADGDLSDDDRKEFGRIMEQRHGKTLLTDVKGNPRAVIFKTNNAVTAAIRERSSTVSIGKKKLKIELVSGGIGKLKRRAAESRSR